MCYAIPAKVVQKDGPAAIIDYFGERRKVRNDFYQDLAVGEYVLAQGGLIIRKVSPEEARASLKGWRELFLKLKKKDLLLSRKSKNLYQTANAVRQKYLGNSCCVHGIIEFSNYCRSDCLYCGIRKSNSSVSRYRMSVDEIVNACLYSARELKFKALVLQSGEDLWYTEERLLEVVRRVMALEPMLLILSIGERQLGLYKRLYQAGARGALVRFETSNPVLYEKYRPGHTLEGRVKLIKELKRMGYLVFTGFMVGLPDESARDIANNIELTHALDPEMFSFGPFLPHPHTPLKDCARPSLEAVLTAIARCRIAHPESRILVTTALETLDKKSGAKKGFLSGANSLMINLTPKKYQPLYQIYPGRSGIESDARERIDAALRLLTSIGRAPSDLGSSFPA